MSAFDVARLALIVMTPTLIGAVVVCAPKWWAYVAERWPRRSPGPEPAGPPIQQLAADLRRLLRLHAELTTSAHLAMRAHRLWAVEAAISFRAVEAARALGVPYTDPGPNGQPDRNELSTLLKALGAAGMVLPEKVGPFVGGGRA